MNATLADAPRERAGQGDLQRRLAQHKCSPYSGLVSADGDVRMAQILEHSRVCCAPAPSARELCLFSCLLASVLLLAHAVFPKRGMTSKRGTDFREASRIREKKRVEKITT